MNKVAGTDGGDVVAVAGATGTIGRAVAAALTASGFDVLALVRNPDASFPDLGPDQLDTTDLSNTDALATMFAQRQIRTIISCIASRSGSPKDAKVADYQANIDLLRAAEAADIGQFILLSAICVQRPKLAFQHAKLAFERELEASQISYTIVRPTAFFKSLSGQVSRVNEGKPFLLFGDGELTRCKPISDRDLAQFIVDCIRMPERRNKILPIGGPGPAISLKDQGKILFEAAGKEPKFRSVPVAMFDFASFVLSPGAFVSDWFAEKAEYARIAKYYATESMLLLDPKSGEYSAEATPEFGEDRLADHYNELLAKLK